MQFSTRDIVWLTILVSCVFTIDERSRFMGELNAKMAVYPILQRIQKDANNIPLEEDWYTHWKCPFCRHTNMTPYSIEYGARRVYCDHCEIQRPKNWAKTRR